MNAMTVHVTLMLVVITLKDHSTVSAILDILAVALSVLVSLG